MFHESYLAPCSHVVSVVFSIGEEKAGLFVSPSFVCLSCMRYLFVFLSSSRCQVLAADCDCGTP